MPSEAPWSSKFPVSRILGAKSHAMSGKSFLLAFFGAVEKFGKFHLRVYVKSKISKCLRYNFNIYFAANEECWLLSCTANRKLSANEVETIIESELCSTKQTHLRRHACEWWKYRDSTFPSPSPTFKQNNRHRSLWKSSRKLFMIISHVWGSNMEINITTIVD